MGFSEKPWLFSHAQVWMTCTQTHRSTQPPAAPRASVGATWASEAWRSSLPVTAAGCKRDMASWDQKGNEKRDQHHQVISLGCDVFSAEIHFLGRRSTSHVDGPCSGTTPLAGMVDDRRPNGIHDARGEAVDFTVTHDILVRFT